MKKLTIEIPEWRGERHIHIFFGREQYAIIDLKNNIHIKTERCNRCGLCCQEPGPMLPEYRPDKNGPKYCAHCEKDNEVWQCKNSAVPFGCIRETPNTLPHKNCIMKYRIEKA
jgi:hypothetical protein